MRVLLLQFCLVEELFVALQTFLSHCDVQLLKVFIIKSIFVVIFCRTIKCVRYWEINDTTLPLSVLCVGYGRTAPPPSDTVST